MFTLTIEANDTKKIVQRPSKFNAIKTGLEVFKIADFACEFTVVDENGLVVASCNYVPLNGKGEKWRM